MMKNCYLYGRKSVKFSTQSKLKIILPFIFNALVLWLVLPASASTCTVGMSHGTIQDAVNDVSCDLILLPNGTYFEKFTINIDRNFVLQGDDPENTVIDGGGSGPIVRNSADIANKITFLNIKITNADNGSTIGGGIINDGTLILSNTIMISNTAPSGAALLNNGVLTVTNSIITENIGDDIITNNNYLYIENSLIEKNDGVSIENEWQYRAVITKSIIRKNQGNVTNFGLMTIINSSIYSNTGSFGGGIRNQSSLVTVPTILTMTHSHVYSNVASTFGGGVYNSGNPTLIITSSSITNNTALDGGGVFEKISSFAHPSNVQIHDTLIENNIATRTAGGLSSDGGRVMLDQTIIRGNVATELGGGLVVGGLEPVFEAKNSLISGNKSVWGGGAYITARSQITFSNSTVSGNVAENGAGIYQRNGTIALNNMTIAYNEALTEAGGIFVGSAILLFKNTIVAQNTAPVGPDCLGELTSEDYNLIGDDTDCTLLGTITNTITNQNPLLSELRVNQGLISIPTHGLLIGSPALDSGSPLTPGSGSHACEVIDQRGESRPQDGNDDTIAVCDIGACECKVSITYLPSILKPS